MDTNGLLSEMGITRSFSYIGSGVFNAATTITGNSRLHLEITGGTAKFIKAEHILEDKHRQGFCNGHCYFCWLENMPLKTWIWRWINGMA